MNRAKTANALKNTLIEHISSGMTRPPSNAQPTDVNVQYGTDQNSNLPPALNSVLPQAQGITSSGSSYNISPEDLAGFAKYLSPADRQINVASPEEIARQQANAAGQKTSAVTQAELPKTQLEIKSRQQIADEANQTRLQAAQIAADQRTKTSAEQNAARKYAADLGYKGRVYAAQINSNGKSKVNEDELGNTATDVALGNADIPSGANGIHVQSILHQQNQVPFGKKNGGDKLDSLNDLDGIFQDMLDASKQLGTNVGGQVIGAVKQHLPIMTDLKNKVGAIQARSPEVVRNVFGIGSGRITNAEINKASEALISGGMTQQQAQENIDKLRRDTYTKVYSDILGSMPTEQKVAVLSAHGGLDRWRGVNINYNGKTIPVIRKMANGREAMFNTNTGNYEGIEDLK